MSLNRLWSWTETATKIDLGGISVNIDHTPGHTRGSVVFRVLQATNNDKDIVFTGDTLFERAIGRTDLAGGSGRDLCAPSSTAPGARRPSTGNGAARARRNSTAVGPSGASIRSLRA